MATPAETARSFVPRGNLRRPACPDSTSGRETSRISLERLTELWDDLVDERVGIVHRVAELPLDDDDPDFFHYYSLACNTSRFTTLKNFDHNGGVSTIRAVAVAKALGEAVERYCSAIFNYKDVLVARFRDLERPAVAPERFALYRPSQYGTEGFPWHPFTHETLVGWTPGVSLLTRDQVLVPASMVFVPYHYIASRGERPIVQPISTGLACGCSSPEAAVSALCEVIERDAFTIHWQSRLTPPCIRPETIPPAPRELIERITELNLEVKVLDATSDLAVPTFLTIVFGTSPHSPAVAVAAATDPSREVALRKCLEELVHTRKYAKQVMHWIPPVPVDVAGGHPEITDQATHLRFYCPQEARALVDFLWRDAPARDFSEVADASADDKRTELQRITALLEARGLEPILFDLTTPDVRELGLHVVRAVVPGMHPLFMGFRNRALGGRRLYEVPALLGQPALGQDQPDNPYPHPFP